MLSLLLDAALRSLALGMVVWVGLRALRVRNPQGETIVWIVVLVASLAMPLLMRAVTVDIPVRTPLPSAVSELLSMPSPAVDLGGPSQPSISGETPSLPQVQPDGGIGYRVPVQHPQVVDWRRAATVLYFVIAAGLLIRLAIGITLTWLLSRTACRIQNAWTGGADVRTSEAVAMPVTFGSAILLPIDHAGWSAVKRMAVLAHEGAHVARRDFYIQLLAAIYRAAFWFNPFAWWLHRRLIELAELASDDAAIEILGDRLAYAEILVDIATTARHAPAGVAMARPAMIGGRVERILAALAISPKIGTRKRTLIAMSVIPLVVITACTIRETARKEDFGRYLGSYEIHSKDAANRILTVLRNGENLFEHSSGQPGTFLFRESDGVYSDNFGKRVTFVPDEHGRVTQITVSENGVNRVGTRVDDSEVLQAEQRAKIEAEAVADAKQAGQWRTARAAALSTREIEAEKRLSKVVAVTSEVLENYAGYYSPPNKQGTRLSCPTCAIVTILHDGDHLSIDQGTGQVIDLYPENANSFVDSDDGLGISFKTHGRHPATDLTLDVAGTAMHMVRVPSDVVREGRLAEQEQAKHREAVAVDPKLLDRYVGSYYGGIGLFLSVTREGDRLFVCETSRSPDYGDDKIELLSDGPDSFFFQDHPAQITFEFDNRSDFSGNLHPGHASRVILHQDGVRRPAHRLNIDQAAADSTLEREAWMAKRASGQTPGPQSEALLRYTIDHLRQGEPNYSRFSPFFDLDTIQSKIAQFGDLQSISFEKVNFVAQDVYRTTFSGGSIEWKLDVSEYGSQVISARVLPQ